MRLHRRRSHYRSIDTWAVYIKSTSESRQSIKTNKHINKTKPLRAREMVKWCVFLTLFPSPVLPVTPEQPQVPQTLYTYFTAPGSTDTARVFFLVVWTLGP